MKKPADAVRATIIDRMDHPALAEPLWDRLVSGSDTESVFQTHGWHQSWWQAFGDAYEPRCVVVSRGEDPIGIVPFAVDRRFPNLVRFMADGRADYCDLIAAAADKPAVISAMFAALEQAMPWDVIELNNIPAASQTVELMRQSCRERGFRLAVDQQFLCPTLLIRGHEASANEIYNKPSLRRPQKTLEGKGSVTSRTMTQAHEVIPRLDAFFEQHISRWSNTVTPSLFCEPRNRVFYRNLTTSLAAKGWLHFSVVEFNEKPIAFHFGFDYGDSLFWYKPSYDILEASRSPGMVLLRHLIGESIERQRRELDFTIGDEPFKRRFTNSVRRTVTLRVFREQSSFFVDRWKQKTSGLAKKLIRRMPAWGAPVWWNQ